MKKITILLLGLCTLLFSPAAEARHHRHYARAVSYAAHPACGMFMPCEGVVTSVRGLKVQRAMGGFGSPAKTYIPRHVSSRRSHIRVAHHEHHKRTREVSNYGAPSPGRGVVKAASGAVAYVAGSATHAFQCVVDKLEQVGYHIKFMGGYASHGHIRHSLHYSGRALDINQVSRNVTTPRMPRNEIEIANSCGLISGAQWADGDSGHFQLGGYAGRSSSRYARRHANHRYASAVR